MADASNVMPEFVRKYNSAGSDVVDADISKTSNLGVKVIEKNMSCVKDGKIIHNSDIIAETIIELICNDLKFQDKQNELEYLLLDFLAKREKKNQAKRKKNNKKIGRREATQSNNEKVKSKFSTKYQDRVKSIKNSDKKTIENRKRVEQKRIEQMKRNSNND